MLHESSSDCTFRCFSGGSSRVVAVAGDCGFADMFGDEVFFRFPDDSASGERLGSTANGGGDGPIGPGPVPVLVVVVVVMDIPEDGLKMGGGGSLFK